MKNRHVAAALALAALVGCKGNVNDGEVFLTTTFRISLTDSGSEANLGSGVSADSIAITNDGRFVYFESNASNLVAGDAAGFPDIFRRDIHTGEVIRVSLAWDGSEPNGPCYRPVCTPDGRYVAFVSNAQNLLSVADAQIFSDIFLKDMQTGTLEKVSLDLLDGETNGASDNPTISADGRYVAFQSTAGDFGDGDLDLSLDIHMRDRTAGSNILLSLNDLGVKLTANNYRPRLTADGEYVFWEGDQIFETGLGGPPTSRNIWRRGPLSASPTTVCVSKDSLNQGAFKNTPASRADCSNLSISPDGRYVVFDTDATNFATNDFGSNDVYFRDMLGTTFVRVSVNAFGGAGNGNSMNPSVSADGRWVTFVSEAKNLVAPDNNQVGDVFVRDLLKSETFRASVRTFGNEANDQSGSPVISGDGRWIAFGSQASNLVDDDFAGVNDVFIRGPLR